MTVIQSTTMSVRRLAGVCVFVLLSGTGCSSSTTATPGGATSSLPELPVGVVTAAVTRPAPKLARALATITRCRTRIDECTAADQRAAQTYVQTVRSLAKDIDVIQTTKRAPAIVRALLADTAAGAKGVVDVATPDLSVLTCGPSAASWPGSRDDCTKRYEALGRAAVQLTDILARWDSVSG